MKFHVLHEGIIIHLEVQMTVTQSDCSITLDAEPSQNHTVKMNSEVKVKDGVVHVVTSSDEGKEVVIAGQ